MPRELELLSAIQAYGAQAVIGRPLGAGEIRRMNVASNVIAYHKQRAASGDWVKWGTDNPDEAALLNRAMLMAEAADDG